MMLVISDTNKIVSYTIMISDRSPRLEYSPTVELNIARQPHKRLKIF